MFLELGQRWWSFALGYMLLSSIVAGVFVAVGLRPPDLLVVFDVSRFSGYPTSYDPRIYIQNQFNGGNINLNPVTVGSLVLAFIQVLVDLALKVFVGIPVFFAKIALLIPVAGPYLAVGASILGAWIQLGFLRYLINLVFNR